METAGSATVTSKVAHAPLAALLAVIVAGQSVSAGFVRLDDDGYATPLGTPRRWADVLAVGRVRREGGVSPARLGEPLRRPKRQGLPGRGSAGDQAQRLILRGTAGFLHRARECRRLRAFFSGVVFVDSNSNIKKFFSAIANHIFIF